MAQTNMVEFLDSFHVSPPHGSVPIISVPLAYFDMTWLPLSTPVQQLFFYKFPHPTSHFMETTLPMLKSSLSLTLQHFYPYAAKIMCPRPPGKPYLRYTEGDFTTFTVVESPTDFSHVIADYQRPVKLLHPFVPQLPSAHVTEDGVRVLPVMAFRVTMFPDSGICIGSSYCHAVGDGKSFMHFMKSWTSVYKSGGDLSCLENSNSLPCLNKDVIKDPSGIELDFLKSYWHWVSSSFAEDSTQADKVRATFVLGRAHAERLKHLTIAECRSDLDLDLDPEQYHISTFVVTCAFVWVCLIKSEDRIVSISNDLANGGDDDDKSHHFLFPFDGRNRLEFPVPTTYFGNCLKPCIVDVKKNELVGENGIILAAKAIGKVIKEVERSDLRGAKHWESSIVERAVTGRLIGVTGSPKLQVYDTDFGWGKPCKVELTNIDDGGVIAMSECNDGLGGIEVAVALNKNQMDEFVTVFEQSLKLL